MFVNRLAIFAATLFCFLGACFVSASEVSRNAPEEWSVFKEELPAVEELLDLPQVKLDSLREDPAIELLCFDRYYRVEPNGRYLYVTHIAKRLLEESGKEDFATESFDLRPSRTIAHIPLARTILQDGTMLDVEDQAIFLEEDRNDSDVLFDDTKTIRIVFPDTQVGSVVEVVCVREVDPLIEGAFARTQAWRWLYPTRSKKLVVDFPDEFRDQMVWEQKQVDVEVEKTRPQEGWNRLQWEDFSIPPVFFENAMPSVFQRGPFVRVGLKNQWSKFGDWYGGLMTSHGEPGSAIEKTSEEWAASEDVMEIADLLLEQVSKEIRYTGLEFGDGAFQPRNPNEVLRTRYGDCKDKANLLRVLLKSRGISSRIGLLHSLRPGEISQKVASTGHFDHAILAVDLPGADQPLFCDPTIPGVPLGLVSPRDQGKDILLIDEKGEIEWTKLPIEEPAKEVLDADLRLEPGGGYSGWFTLKASGVHGHFLKHRYASLDRAGRGSNVVESFFRYINGIRIVDSEEIEDPEFPFHYRFYALQAENSIEASEKTVQFSLPLSQTVITRVGPEDSIRDHSFLMSPVIVQSNLKLRLPRDWEVLDYPSAFHRRGDGYTFHGNWNSEDETVLEAQLSMERTGREFKARDFSSFSNHVRELMKWATTSSLVRKDSEASQDWAPNPKRLPKMPSSEGYTALVNTRFPFDLQAPFDADHKKRRIAFERMRELYSPSDHEAQFVSRHMENASRFFTSTVDETKEIIVEMKEIIAEYADKVSPEKIASSEIVLAASLFEIGQVEAAKSVSLGILEMEEIPEILRHGASAIVGGITCFEDPAKASEYCRMAMQNPFLNEYEWEELELILLLCEAVKEGESPALSRIDEAVLWLEKTFPDRYEEGAPDVTVLPAFATYGGYQKIAEKLSRSLRRESDRFELTKKEKRELRRWEERLEKVKPLYVELKRYLEENPWPDLDKDGEGFWARSAADCFELYLDDPAEEFRYLLRGMVAFGPQPDWIERAEELNQVAMVWLRKLEKGKASELPPGFDDLMARVNQLSKEAPATEYSKPESIYDYEFDYLEKRMGVDEAIAYAKKYSMDMEISGGVRAQLARKLAAIFVEEDKVFEYLTSIETIASNELEDYWWKELVSEGAYVALANGHEEKALKWFQAASEQMDVDLEKEVLVGREGAVYQIISDLEKSKKWWEGNEEWWPVWKEVSMALELNALDHPWAARNSWRRPSAKRFATILEMEGEERVEAVRKILPRMFHHMRWHPEGADSMKEFVRSVASDFPENKKTIEDLLDLISGEAGAGQ